MATDPVSAVDIRDPQTDVGTFLREHPIPADSTLIAAVSGGADSLALLVLLAESRQALGYRLRAAHLHHGMRAEADADAAMLSRLCDGLGVPLDVGHADVPSIARDRRLSLEVAGREARYAFLYETAAAHSAHAICTGHTKDDQAETVLLRVIAGTGLEGLSGIAPARIVEPPESESSVWLMRPLLSVNRAETEAVCAARGLTPVRDPYNEDPAYPRNRVRHELLPLLERGYNPAIRDALARLADIVRPENELLEGLTDQAISVVTGRDGAWMSRMAFLALAPALQRRCARRLLRAAGGIGPALRFTNVERLVDAITSGASRTQLRGALTVECEGDRAMLRATPPMAAG